MPEHRKQKTEPDTDYRMIFQLALDAMIVIHPESGKILAANRKARELFKGPDGVLEGQHYSLLFPEGPPAPGSGEPRNIRIYDAVILQEFRLFDGSRRFFDLTLTLIPWPAGDAVLASIRDASGRILMEQEQDKLICELKQAMEKIKTLRGLLPICSHCKKVRNDEGYWQQVEVYVRDHSMAEFSHGICPDCMKKYYSEYFGEDS